MASRVSHTTFDCHNAFALCTWWKQVLDYSDVVGDPNEPGDEECMIVDPASGHRVLFIEVDDDKVVKNRVHLDLVPTDRRRDPEIGPGCRRGDARRRSRSPKRCTPTGFTVDGSVDRVQLWRRSLGS